MDSLDSSSSPSPLAASADDDGSLSITAGLAKEAALLFQARKFADCLKVLNQLLQKKEGDPKVLHNIAIAENSQDGCLDPKKLLNVLHNVKDLQAVINSTAVKLRCISRQYEDRVAQWTFFIRRSEELARASGENVGAVSNLGSKAMTGTKGTTSMAHQFSATNSSSIVYNDEFDTSVTMYNIAVIWFHLHEYANSFSILEPLYQNIQPINEGTALRICLLFLDVALLSHHALRSADVINYVEKVFCVDALISQGDNGNSTQLQSSPLVTKSSSIPSNAHIPDASNSDSAASVNALESPLSRTLSEDAEYENLFSTLDISVHNLSRPHVLHSSNDLPRTQIDDSISTIDLRLKLHLLKVRFLLLTRNPKAAKREVKMAMNIARGIDYSMALFLKSQLEYACGNYRKAIKLLMASSNRTETGTSSIYYNNLGCIYHRLGKHHTSTVFFSKALSSSSSFRKEKPLKLSAFSQDKSLLIIYNCGLQYLACGKPILAARCFHKASLIFYNRPVLWLRIAECCLMVLEKGLLKSSVSPSSRSEIGVHVIGKGKWRQLGIEEGGSRNGRVDFVGRDDLFSGDDRQPNLSMTLARQCLFNALHLLDCSESKYSRFGLPSNSDVEENEASEKVLSKNSNDQSVSVGDSQAPIANGEVKEQKGGNSLNVTLQSSISDYKDIYRRENHVIKQALLADLSYVELELGNPLNALSTARSLLKLPECSRIYIFLGNVYAAESLCLLNRPKDAAEHLLIYLSNGNNVQLPYSQEDREQWRAEKTMDFEESNGGSVAANTSSLEESQDSVFLNPEEARGILYANLATMAATEGNLEQAHQFVTQALSAIPNSLEAILTAIYVDLMYGKTQEAIAKLKQCSHIRFLPGSLTVNGSS